MLTHHIYGPQPSIVQLFEGVACVQSMKNSQWEPKNPGEMERDHQGVVTLV